MDRFECTSTDACRQYCEALRVQGVEITMTADGCSAPDLFEIGPDGVTFNPGAEVENSSLVSSLGGALCEVLAQEQQNAPEAEEAAKLTTLYEAQFAAKKQLWEAMIGATREGRQFTDVEREHYETAIGFVDDSVADIAEGMSAEAILRAQAAFDRETLETDGLVFDEQISEVVNRMVGNLMDGKPTLAVGDKGIAKTQVARFVAGLWDGGEREPIIISGHGDQMADEFMGKVVQDKESKTFIFKEGKLVQAMRDGRPVIVDEVNISEQAIVMRLQDILLRRPGDKIVLQENGGEEIEIQPGFVVFATANEASARYQHRARLDPAFRDRFNVIQVSYPDAGGEDPQPLTDIPRSLMRLALASAVDERGVLSEHIPAGQLETLVRLAYATQHLYSVPSKDVAIAELRPKSTSEFLGGDEPLMTDCITPRALVETIERCSTGNKPDMSLETETSRLILSLDQAGSTANRTHAEKLKALLTK